MYILFLFTIIVDPLSYCDIGDILWTTKWREKIEREKRKGKDTRTLDRMEKKKKGSQRENLKKN